MKALVRLSDLVKALEIRRQSLFYSKNGLSIIMLRKIVSRMTGKAQGVDRKCCLKIKSAVVAYEI